MKRIEVKKGQILQKIGELNTKVYHVESGLLRSYSIDKNGKENIFLFAPEGWVMADYNSPDTPAALFIDALENSIVTVIPKDIQQEQKHTTALIKRLSVLQSRVIMLISTNAIERYESFLRNYPDIAQRVPQRMIASYLGVTPETLSAAKKERYKKLNNSSD